QYPRCGARRADHRLHPGALGRAARAAMDRGRRLRLSDPGDGAASTRPARRGDAGGGMSDSKPNGEGGKEAKSGEEGTTPPAVSPEEGPVAKSPPGGDQPPAADPPAAARPPAAKSEPAAEPQTSAA